MQISYGVIVNIIIGDANIFTANGQFLWYIDLRLVIAMSLATRMNTEVAIHKIIFNANGQLIFAKLF